MNKRFEYFRNIINAVFEMGKHIQYVKYSNMQYQIL